MTALHPLPPSADIDIACHNCRFWHVRIGEGECRRRSPVVVMQPGQRRPEAAWPLTGGLDTCGEWRLRVTADSGAHGA